MELKYAKAVVSLLPPGKIWEHTWIRDLLIGVSKIFANIESYAIRIFETELPDNVLVNKEEWGRVLNLDHPNTISIRAALGATGGQTKAEYENLISQISPYTEIKRITPSVCGMRCGDYCAGYSWKFVIILSNIGKDHLETMKTTISRVQHAHIVFLYQEDKWTE